MSFGIGTAGGIVDCLSVEGESSDGLTPLPVGKNRYNIQFSFLFISLNTMFSHRYPARGAHGSYV